MRIQTSIVAVIVTLAFAAPVMAGTQTGPYIGTMPTATPTAAATVQQAPSVFCNLTVAAVHFWTYSCPGGTSGTSTGAIPRSCKTTLETGYLSMFSCPSSAFAGKSAVVKAASTGEGGTATVAPLPCMGWVTVRYTTGPVCLL